MAVAWAVLALPHQGLGFRGLGFRGSRVRDVLNLGGLGADG